MRILISYFYQIRFLKPNQVPYSTAMYDPKWFHQGKGNEFTYLDSHGVINGLRVECLSPYTCAHDCSPRDCTEVPDKCYFLTKYKHQLDEIPFEDFIKELELDARNQLGSRNIEGEPEVILLVYEDPSNSCSERVKLIEWFKEHNYELKEFKHEN